MIVRALNLYDSNCNIRLRNPEIANSQTGTGTGVGTGTGTPSPMSLIISGTITGLTSGSVQLNLNNTLATTINSPSSTFSIPNVVAGNYLLEFGNQPDSIGCSINS